MTRPDDIGPWTFTPADNSPCVDFLASGRTLDEVETALVRFMDRDGLTPDEVVDLGLLSARDVEEVTGWPCVGAA